MTMLEIKLDEIKKMLYYDNKSWPLHCSLSGNTIKKIDDIIFEILYPVEESKLELPTCKYTCSTCGDPYDPSFNLVKEATSYLNETWCPHCKMVTKIKG